MKKVIFSLAFIVCVSFLIVSFTAEKEVFNTIPQSSIEKGKRLFKKNACTGCHQEQKKIIGPSVKDIATKYIAKKGNLIHFLQGKSDPIVDTDPGQIAIMKASLGITKNMKAEDLKALYDYIMSIK